MLLEEKAKTYYRFDTAKDRIIEIVDDIELKTHWLETQEEKEELIANKIKDSEIEKDVSTLAMSLIEIQKMDEKIKADFWLTELETKLEKLSNWVSDSNYTAGFWNTILDYNCFLMDIQESLNIIPSVESYK